MSFGWLSDVRGAGLLEGPARTFAAAEIGEDPGAHAPLLLALARAIDRFASREVTPQDEARFVEGAGALFGIVLLAHVGEGEHVTRNGVHRVRLGKAGFVDPFAAIQHALDEGPAKKILVEATKRAELEGRGEGPIARVALAFERMLVLRDDPRTVTGRFDRMLFLGEIEVDLTRTIEATAFESEATLTRSVEKLVLMLPGGSGAVVEREEGERRLLPRLVGAAFDVPGAIVLLPLVPDVRVALVLAYEGRSRFVSGHDLDRWGLDGDAALATAVLNLGAREPRLARLDTDHGPMVMARTGDGLDSARLLLPSLHEILAGELGDPFFAAVPHRDVLLACASGVPALETAFRTRVEGDAARAPHAISPRVYVSERGALAPR